MSAPVAVPRLTSRSSRRWVLGTAVLVVGLLGYLWVTEPANRWTAAVVLPLVALVALGALGSRRWVDPDAGTATWQGFFVLRTTVSVQQVSAVELVSNRGGGVLLALRTGRRRRFLPVLALTPYIQAAQPAEVCRALAALTAACARPGDVPARLREQAEAVAKGVPPERTPLARLATGWLGRLAGGSGAVGGGFSQLP